MSLFGRRAAVFEVTVEGELGPVFRTALRPCRVVDTSLCTVLVTSGAPGMSVEDLVRLLESRGVPVKDVIVHDSSGA